jgi:hypothetical protein
MIKKLMEEIKEMLVKKRTFEVYKKIKMNKKSEGLKFVMIVTLVVFEIKENVWNNL